MSSIANEFTSCRTCVQNINVTGCQTVSKNSGVNQTLGIITKWLLC